MRVTKAGIRYAQDLNAQDFDQRKSQEELRILLCGNVKNMIHTLSYFRERWGFDGLAMTTAMAALKNLQDER